MKIEFYTKSGEKGVAKDWPASLTREVKDEQVLEYIRYVRNAIRNSIADVKDRSEVAGGGRKPWKQKGTGNARHGSRRSPIWSGGGITFGPTSARNFTTRMNKRQRRDTLLSVFSSLIKDKKVIGTSGIKIETPKTKEALKSIEKLPLSGKIGIILSREEEAIKKSFNNLPYVSVIPAERLNVLKLMTIDNVVVTDDSLKRLIEVFSPKVVEDKVNE